MKISSIQTKRDASIVGILMSQKFLTEYYHETTLTIFLPVCSCSSFSFTELLQTSLKFSSNFTLLKHSSPCKQGTCLSISVGFNYHFRLLEYDFLWPPMMLIFLPSADLNHLYIYEFLFKYIHYLHVSTIIIIIDKVSRCSLNCIACNTLASWNCWSVTFV